MGKGFRRRISTADLKYLHYALPRTESFLRLPLLGK
jgi:hypothetical protein